MVKISFLLLAVALAVYYILCTNIYKLQVLNSHPRETDNNVTDSKPLPLLPDTYDHLHQLQLPTSYQCALVWLRLPKTASTTVVKTFVGPLVKAANFSNTGLGPNTCLSHPSGCTDLWQRRENQQKGGNNNQRCVLSSNVSVSKIRCWEYDHNHSTIHFGPHLRNPKEGKTKYNKIRHDKTTAADFVTAKFDLHPYLRTHVAIDVSLLGWILPTRPMMFSTFRRPIDRLLSSFHYGIQFGGDLPGQVMKCALPGGADLHEWQSQVISARRVAALEKNLTFYQQALRDYLSVCRYAVDNVYVQFLDPRTKDVDVALQHLEKYFIVGMQSDLEQSLQRWSKIALWSCRDHPNANAILKALTDPNNVGAHFRESTSLMKQKEKDEGTNNTENLFSSVELASPTIDELEPDLQQLIKILTVYDEIIFRRAEELYDEQGKWFLRKNSQERY